MQQWQCDWLNEAIHHRSGMKCCQVRSSQAQWQRANMTFTFVLVFWTPNIFKSQGLKQRLYHWSITLRIYSNTFKIFDIFDQIQGCGVFPPIVITLIGGHFSHLPTCAARWALVSVGLKCPNYQCAHSTRPPRRVNALKRNVLHLAYPGWGPRSMV